MLGFLSTFIPSSARPGFGAASDGAVNNGDLKGAPKTLKEEGSKSFHSAFAEDGPVRPEMADALENAPVGESLARAESDSTEQAEIEIEEGDSLGSPHPGKEEGALDASQEGQLNSESAEDDQGNPIVYAPVNLMRTDPAFLRALQGGTPNNATTFTDSDPYSDGDWTQDVSVPVQANQNSSSADMGRESSKGAYQLPFAGTSVDGLRVQSVLLEGAAAGMRGAPLLQTQGVPIPEALSQQDQNVLLEAPVLTRDGQTIAAEANASGGAITSLASGWAQSKDSPLSGRYSATKDPDVRTPMGTATDITRNAVSSAPESMVATFAADLSEDEEGGRSIVTLTEPAISSDPRPSPSTTTELRMSAIAGGSTPQMARHVAIQLSEAVGKAADRAIDLTLNPSELGRVRITLTPGDGGMVVSVSAERPETLDLMRRHIDVLDQEFRDLGYGATDFTFSKEESGTGHADTNRSGDMSRPEDVSNSAAEHSPSRIASVVIADRLDIRL